MKLTEEDCLKCGLCCFFGVFAAGAEYRGIICGEDGWCIYYDQKQKCTIHEEKPQICKDFKIGYPDCMIHRENGLKLGKI